MPQTKLQPIFAVRAPLGEPSHPPFGLYATSAQNFETARQTDGIKNVVLYEFGGARIYDPDFDEQTSDNTVVSLPYSLVDQGEFSALTAFEPCPRPRKKSSWPTRPRVTPCCAMNW